MNARDLAQPLSWASSVGVRNNMRANRGRNTGPEMRIRQGLHALGYRYRVDVRPVRELNRRADIVFYNRRLAIFVDGCFWHGCPEHHVSSKTNEHYWSAKVTTNMSRDVDTNIQLEAKGWRVLRVWEHETASQALRQITLAAGNPKFSV